MSLFLREMVDIGAQGSCSRENLPKQKKKKKKRTAPVVPQTAVIPGVIVPTKLWIPSALAS
jgi:hypothetical protein